MDYALLRNYNFTKLWLAQMLSATAQHLLNFALIIRVFELAQGTRFANVSVAILVLSYGIPSVLFAVIAGVYVDRWNRKRVMLVANLVRAVLVLGFLAVEHNLLLVFLLSFIIASTTQFFVPAEAASIPRLVEEPHLVGANSLFVLSFYATFILGYSVSAPLIKLAGNSAPYIVASVMFAAAAVLSLWLPTMKVAQAARQGLSEVVRYTYREVMANWRMILKNIDLYFPMSQLTLTQAMVGVVLTLAPALSLALLKRPLPDASQYLIIPAGLGMVLGVTAVGRLTRRFAKTIVIKAAAVGAGIGLILLGLTGQLYRTIAGTPIGSVRQVGILVASLVLVLGVLNAIISATAQTVLQESTSDEERGKIFGSLNMLINLAATLPILVAATLVDVFNSVTRVIDAVGIAVLLIALGQIWYMRPKKRATKPSSN